MYRSVVPNHTDYTDCSDCDHVMLNCFVYSLIMVFSELDVNVHQYLSYITF
jgi:hypothetical protein